MGIERIYRWNDVTENPLAGSGEKFSANAMSWIAESFVKSDWNTFATEEYAKRKPGQTATDDGNRLHARTAPKK
jgi:hypothetical protein